MYPRRGLGADPSAAFPTTWEGASDTAAGVDPVLWGDRFAWTYTRPAYATIPDAAAEGQIRFQLPVIGDSLGLGAQFRDPAWTDQVLQAFRDRRVIRSGQFVAAPVPVDRPLQRVSRGPAQIDYIVQRNVYQANDPQGRALYDVLAARPVVTYGDGQQPDPAEYPWSWGRYQNNVTLDVLQSGVGATILGQSYAGSRARTIVDVASLSPSERAALEASAGPIQGETAPPQPTFPVPFAAIPPGSTVAIPPVNSGLLPTIRLPGTTDFVPVASVAPHQWVDLTLPPPSGPPPVVVQTRGDGVVVTDGGGAVVNPDGSAPAPLTAGLGGMGFLALAAAAFFILPGALVGRSRSREAGRSRRR